MAQKPKQPLSQGDVIDAASKLEYFAKRYRDLAQVMKAREVEAIEAGNLKSFRLALDNIRMAINRAYEAYDAALMKSGMFAEGKRLSDAMLEEAAKHAQQRNDQEGKPKRARR